jgi:hypothetical protein
VLHGIPSFARCAVFSSSVAIWVCTQRQIGLDGARMATHKSAPNTQFAAQGLFVP